MAQCPLYVEDSDMSQAASINLEGLQQYLSLSGVRFQLLKSEDSRFPSIYRLSLLEIQTL